MVFEVFCSYCGHGGHSGHCGYSGHRSNRSHSTECTLCTLCTVCTLQVECEYDAVWTPKPLHGGTVMPRCIREWKQTNYFSFFKIFHPAINCTEPPFQVRNNDMGMYNWTGVDGEDPRPFATSIEYFCPREGWGYPRSDLSLSILKYFNTPLNL